MSNKKSFLIFNSIFVIGALACHNATAGEKNAGQVHSQDLEGDEGLIAKGDCHGGGGHHGHHHGHRHGHHHNHHWRHHHGDPWWHHAHHPGWHHHHWHHWHHWHNPWHSWYWYNAWNGHPGYFYDPNYYYFVDGVPSVEYEYDEPPETIQQIENNYPIFEEKEKQVTPENEEYFDDKQYEDEEEDEEEEENAPSK